MLELKHKVARGVVIEAGRSGPGEHPGLGHAGGAANARAEIVFERRAAAVTDRRLQKGDAAPRFGREPLGLHGRAVVQRAWRQDQVEQAARRNGKMRQSRFPRGARGAI